LYVLPQSKNIGMLTERRVVVTNKEKDLENTKCAEKLWEITARLRSSEKFTHTKSQQSFLSELVRSTKERTHHPPKFGNNCQAQYLCGGCALKCSCSRALVCNFTSTSLQVQVYKCNFTSSISSILQCNFTSTIFQALLVQPQSKCQLLFLIGWFRIRKISALYIHVVVSMYYLEWQNPMYVCSACVRCELATNVCS
jgi:hypothetical protein